VFHVILVLPWLIIVGFIVAIVLFGIGLLIACLVGGTSAAVFLKNKVAKKLVLSAISIFALSGLACASPLPMVPLGNLSIFVLPSVLIAIAAAIIKIAKSGEKTASTLENSVLETVLVVFFKFFAIAAWILIVFTLAWFILMVVGTAMEQNGV